MVLDYYHFDKHVAAVTRNFQVKFKVMISPHSNKNKQFKKKFKRFGSVAVDLMDKVRCHHLAMAESKINAMKCVIARSPNNLVRKIRVSITVSKRALRIFR